jgi:hypothetical protein
VLVHAALRAEGRKSVGNHLTPSGAIRALGLSGGTLEAAGLSE